MSMVVQHYQTSFVIKNDIQSAAEKLRDAQLIIKQWVEQRETNRYRKHAGDPKVSFLVRNKNFLRTATYESTYSWCKTKYFECEDTQVWAMEYTHRDAKVRDVFWIAEIGLRSFKETKDLVVSVKISYKLTTEFVLKRDEYKPSVSIPRCVKNIIEEFKTKSSFFSGGQDVTMGLSDTVTISSKEEALSILEYIRSNDRKLAIVLLLGESPDVKQEAKLLRENLFAKALVFIVPYNYEIRHVFNYYSLEFEDCIFIPAKKINTREISHAFRYSVKNKDDAQKKREALFYAWLTTYSIFEAGEICDLNGVMNYLSFSMYKKLEKEIQESVPVEEYENMKNLFLDARDENIHLEHIYGEVVEQYEELEEKHGEVVEKYEELEEKHSEVVEERAKLIEEKDVLENQNISLMLEKDKMESEHATEIHNIRETHNALSRKTSSNDYALPREYPNSFEALKKYEKFYTHLAFADTAWEPALNYRNFNKDFEKVWQMLHDMDQILWALFFEENNCDIEKEFKNRSIFEFAKTEGKKTSNDSTLAAKREFVFENKTWGMWQHIKFGKDPGKLLRIYFDIDHEKRRIIIGHIGNHLDNATTKTRH